MKVFQYVGPGGVDSLGLVEIPVPVVGPGQVLIRVRAASVSCKDLFVANGIPPCDQSIPLIPISDGAGEIIEVSSGVTRVKVGDRVAAIGWKCRGRIAPSAGLSRRQSMIALPTVCWPNTSC